MTVTTAARNKVQDSQQQPVLPETFLSCYEIANSDALTWGVRLYKVLANGGGQTHSERGPYCAYCGTAENVQVHHMEPYHLKPEKELDPDNLWPLCGPPYHHHFWVGHFGDFAQFNPKVREMCKEFRASAHRYTGRILLDKPLPKG